MRSMLLEQLYLGDETLAWARAGLDSADGHADGHARAPTLDSNGSELADGDAVTLVSATANTAGAVVEVVVVVK